MTLEQKGCERLEDTFWYVNQFAVDALHSFAMTCGVGKREKERRRRRRVCTVQDRKLVTRCQEDDMLLNLVAPLLLIILSTSHVARGQCTSSVCSEVREYIKSAADISRWNDVCVNPFEKFCVSQIKGNRTLLQLKADEYSNIRENIFTRKWDTHVCSIVRNVAGHWRRCVEKDSRQHLMISVTQHLKWMNQRINQRVKYDKVMYLVPQLYLHDETIEKQVDSMNQSTLCSHQMYKLYPYVIDRMYIESIAFDHRQKADGCSLLKQMLDRATALLKESPSYKAVRPKLFQECIDKMNKMKIKCGYPDALLDDALLKQMYPEKDDLHSLVPPQEFWALSVYPEAIWYNGEENALCE